MQNTKGGFHALLSPSHKQVRLLEQKAEPKSLRQGEEEQQGTDCRTPSPQPAGGRAVLSPREEGQQSCHPGLVWHSHPEPSR